MSSNENINNIEDENKSEILTDLICLNSTVEQAKEYLRKRWVKGATCPCCNQFVKRYKRKVTTITLIALILAYKKFGINIPFHYEGFWKEQTDIKGLPYNTDFYKLHYWGLAKPAPEIPKKHEGAKSCGFWIITELGEQFILGKVPIKQFINVYNKKNWGFEGEDVYISQCWKNKFNYQELMEGKGG